MKVRESLVQVTADGLFCPLGDFFIDPWRPVAAAVVTHAHADHATRGCGGYLTSEDGQHVLRARMDIAAKIDTLAYGRKIRHRNVVVSLHPAGHILGSAQVRLEHDGYVCVISGDYKTEPDATCKPFEPVRCDEFITESTFGLPIYRWPSQREVFDEINQWWAANSAQGRASVILAYSLGKAQRVIGGVDPSIGPIYCHGAVERMNRAYRESHIALPDTRYAGQAGTQHDWRGALIVAPPSALGSPWIRRFAKASTAFASGWMRVRGARRRRSVDRGFVLSDHADWPGLQHAIHATGAQRVLVTHGSTLVMSRWLNEQGWESAPLETNYIGERDDADVDAAELTDASGDES
ncbi:MAG: ligase-associated DNA damage response exonuclease [Phycisphaerae bacterium]